MRTLATLIGIAVIPLMVSACSPQFWGGAAAGALGTGAGYEVQANRQMDRLEEDLERGRINRREYEARRQQIERGSIIY